MVNFPHAQNYEVDDGLFVAAWCELCLRHVDQTAVVDLPVRNAAVTLGTLLSQGRAFSLEVLCRTLVPAGYRNTMQATPQFFENNDHIVIPTILPTPRGPGNGINGAALTPEAIINATQGDNWQDYLAEAERLFAADWDAAVQPGGDLEIVAEPAGPQPGFLYAIAGQQGDQPGDQREAVLNQLVTWIDGEPLIPMYRRQQVDDLNIANGWNERLLNYFWPNPNQGYEQSLQAIAAWQGVLIELVQGVLDGQEWAEPEVAVDLANQIFEWGGVRQANVDHGMVRACINRALNLQQENAPMNSGWTKLAAFATGAIEHMHPNLALAIWDSRVATSVCWRLEQILVLRYANEADDMRQQLFADVGSVNGRNAGTRPRRLNLNWPNAYGNWARLDAGSAVVREMRGILNAGHFAHPHDDQWTVRDVDMVLFMDGY